MKLEGEQMLLRVHLASGSLTHGRPVYEELVDRARRSGLAGATVLRGLAGFVRGGPLLIAHPGSLRDTAAVVVEMVDTAPNLKAFVEQVEPLLRAIPAVVTTERAHVLIYRSRPPRGHEPR